MKDIININTEIYKILSFKVCLHNSLLNILT